MPGNRYLIFYFYGLVFTLYVIGFYSEIIAAIEYPQVLIAPIMTFGSFVAGATFLGGGAVAFPAMTKILGADPVSAKIFSLAIQSVGMSAASLYILSRNRQLPFKLIGMYLVGASIGYYLCVSFAYGYIPPADIRIGFTLFVLCFLMVYLWTHRYITKTGNQEAKHNRVMSYELISTQTTAICICGIAGGFISGLIGSGADLIIFCLLSLYYRLDIKQATQISVISMAAMSIIGTLFQVALFEPVTVEIKQLWLLAAPIVLFGAPLGAIFCRKTSPQKLLNFITIIVALEVVSTLLLIDISLQKIPVYLLVMAMSIFSLSRLYQHSPYFSK